VMLWQAGFCPWYLAHNPAMIAAATTAEAVTDGDHD
jgi:hypothetical protein